MKDKSQGKYLDQKKLVKMISKALKAGAKLPEGISKEAVLGVLEAIAEEAKKPLPSPPQEKTNLH